MDNSQTDNSRPAWDEERAKTLAGALVLIGLTRSGPDGEHLEQMFGTVVSARPQGIEVALGGTRAGKVFRLPPDLTAFHPASPGEYRLRSTGEVVTDPAFTTTWVINQGTE